MCCAPPRPLYILFSQRKGPSTTLIQSLGSARGEACFSQMNILSLTVGALYFSQKNILSFTVDTFSSHEGAFSFSQKNTDEQNTQRRTETLSQPISQNLTPTFSYNVL